MPLHVDRLSRRIFTSLSCFWIRYHCLERRFGFIGLFEHRHPAYTGYILAILGQLKKSYTISSGERYSFDPLLICICCCGGGGGRAILWTRSINLLGRMFLGHQFLPTCFRFGEKVWSTITNWLKLREAFKGKTLKREETDCCLINPALV